MVLVETLGLQHLLLVAMTRKYRLKIDSGQGKGSGVPQSHIHEVGSPIVYGIVVTDELGALLSQGNTIRNILLEETAVADTNETLSYYVHLVDFVIFKVDFRILWIICIEATRLQATADVIQELTIVADTWQKEEVVRVYNVDEQVFDHNFLFDVYREQSKILTIFFKACCSIVYPEIVEIEVYLILNGLLEWSTLIESLKFHKPHAQVH